MNYEITAPDYGNSILGIPNSILAHFGAKPHHATLPALDERLRKKDWKNVVLLLFDGMGVDALDKDSPGGFFQRHSIAGLSSVCPCTTTSALTTYETGLSPIEHGWLGWSCYFREIGKCVDLFSGNQSGTKRPAADHNIVWENLGYQNLLSQVQAASPGIECRGVSPFSDVTIDSCEKVCAQITELCKKEGRRLICAYHYQPDHDMHEFGCYDGRVQAMIRSYESQVEAMCAELDDTLLIISADHGLIDVKVLLLEDFPEIAECLRAPLSREMRNLSLYIKDEFKDVFPDRWNARFEDSYHLMPADEAINAGYFGPGALHARARDFMGDYVAFATGELGLSYRDEQGEYKNFAATHAGLCREEMMVPFIVVEC